MYWLIWVVCVVGWIHTDRKYKATMMEYEELRKDYVTRFEDEDI